MDARAAGGNCPGSVPGWRQGSECCWLASDLWRRRNRSELDPEPRGGVGFTVLVPISPKPRPAFLTLRVNDIARYCPLLIIYTLFD